MKKHEGAITSEALERLLACLDADREQAGEKYVLLRRKLAGFFRWRGAASPDDCADRTLNVAARRLVDGQEVRSLASYCAGIARMVLLETLREREQQRIALEELASSVPAQRDTHEARRMAIFEARLDALPRESRELILAYYQAAQHDKIASRRQLAARLGIPRNALRIRAFRIRTRLEESVNALMGQSPTRAK